MIYQVDPSNWVKEHADYLYAFAFTRLNDEERAKDLVQDAFLAGLERLNRFEGKSSIRTWLTAILKNKIIDEYRKKSSGLKTTQLIDVGNSEDIFFDENSGSWLPDKCPIEFGLENQDEFNKKEFEQVLHKCFQKLPKLWEAIFIMKYMDDEPADFICKELKVTNSNFWVITHRTKLKLRACLQNSWL